MLTPHHKILMLQKQIATLSLTVASLQTQMTQMEISIESLKSEYKPIKIIEPTPEELAIQLAPNDLDVDDGSSDGYDTDEAPQSFKKPKIRTKTSNHYVIISDDGNDSGYEDSDCEDSKDIGSLIPLLDKARLDPIETDKIAQELQARASLLEEVWAMGAFFCIKIDKWK